MRIHMYKYQVSELLPVKSLWMERYHVFPNGIVDLLLHFACSACAETFIKTFCVPAQVKVTELHLFKFESNMHENKSKNQC